MGINRGYSIRKIRMKNRYVHPLAKLDRTGGTAALSFPEDKTYLEHHIMFTIFDIKRKAEWHKPTCFLKLGTEEMNRKSNI